MARIFISQKRVDKLSERDRVVIAGNRMDVPALGAHFRIQPAVHFLRLVSEGTDGHNLIGRVKTDEQLRALGAELMETSVLLGEAAYECETGFLGEVMPPDSSPPDPPPQPPHGPSAPPKD